MSKFDTIRDFLEEVADPETNEEMLRALNLVYQNAQEIISCYPDVATFLINVVNAIETFPIKRVNEAKVAIRKNIRIYRRCDEELNPSFSNLTYREENWEKNIKQRLRTALREHLGTSLTALGAIMNKIECAQGIDYTKGEVFAFVQSRKSAGDLYLKASACSGDTYYLVRTSLRYVVLIQDPDLSGTLYEVDR